MELSTFNITEKEFQLFSKLVYDTIGINLTVGKKELVRTRLGKRLRKLGISTFKDYYNYVTKEDKGELTHLFDAISTNLTSFFREEKHFDYLKQVVLPEIVAEKQARGSSTMRVWCCASSTGEEPYSLAITLSEFLDNMARWDLKILATDINTEVLGKAEAGIYKKERIVSLPRYMQSKYFLDGIGKQTGMVKVRKELKDVIRFRRLNLTVAKYPFKKEFDFIFCRNVMIYFDKSTQKLIVDRLYSHLKKGGYLFLGHAESLTGIESDFKYIQPTIYRKI